MIELSLKEQKNYNFDFALLCKIASWLTEQIVMLSSEMRISAVVVAYNKEEERMSCLIVPSNKEDEDFILNKILNQPPGEYKEKYVTHVIGEALDSAKEDEDCAAEKKKDKPLEEDIPP